MYAILKSVSSCLCYCRFEGSLDSDQLYKKKATQTEKKYQDNIGWPLCLFNL